MPRSIFEEMALQEELNKIKKYGVSNPDSFKVNRDKQASPNEQSHVERLKLVDEVMNLDVTKPSSPTDSNMAVDFAGNLVWGGLSSASWGTLDVAALTDVGKATRENLALGAYRPWDQQTGSGKVGYIIGQGVGMLASFSWASKLLSAGTNLTSKAITPIAKGLQKKMTAEIAEQYAENLTKNNITKAFDIAADVSDPAAAKELLESGLGQYIKMGQEKLSEVGYRKVFQNHMSSITKATDDIGRAILDMGGEKVTTEAAQDLANKIVGASMKYNSRDFHKVIGLGTEGLSKILPLGLKNQTFRSVVDATLAEAALGITYTNASYLLKNISAPMVEAAFGEKGTISEEELASPENKAHWVALRGGLMDKVNHLAHEALLFGVTGPTRLIKGGRVGLWDDIKNNWSAYRKSLTPIKKMTDEELKAGIHLIDGISKPAGASYGQVAEMLEGKMKGLDFKDFVDAAKPSELRKIMLDIRSQFGSNIRNNIGSELMKDIWGSLPRMVSGGLAMNLPAFADYYNQTGGDPRVWRAFGSDMPEILTNVVMGMALSKPGLSTHSGKGFWAFEHSKEGPRKAYADMESLNKMQASMDILPSMWEAGALREYSNGQSFIKTKLLSTGGYHDIDQILSKEYTHGEELLDIKEGHGDLTTAGLEWVLSHKPSEQAAAMRQYEKATAVLEHYDNRITTNEFTQTLMDAEHAGVVIKDLNNIPVVRDSENIEVTLSHMESDAIVKTKDSYEGIVKSFVAQAFETITGSKIEVVDGVMTIPNIDIGRATSGSDKHGTAIKDVLQTLVKDGIGNNWIRQKGQVTEPSTSAAKIASLEKIFLESNDIMQYNIWGSQENHYVDKYVMRDRTMYAAYLQGKALEQSINTAAVFSDSNLNKKSFLDKDVESQLRDKIASLNIGSNTSLEVSTANVSGDDIAKANAFLSRVKEIQSLTGNNRTSGESEISIDAVLGLLKQTDSTLGIDAFSDTGYRDIKNYIEGEFITNLRISDSDNRYSVSQGLASLISDFSGVSGASSEIRNLFAQKRDNKYELPSSRHLEEFLRDTLGQKPKDVEDIMSFYTALENAVTRSGSGKMISFAGGKENLTAIGKKLGDDATSEIMSFLRRAQSRYSLGGIKDTADLVGKLAFTSKDIEDNIFNAADAFTDTVMKEGGDKELKSLINRLKDVKETIADLFILKDYERIAQLTSISKKGIITQLQNFSKDAFQEGITKDTFDSLVAEAKASLMETELLIAGSETSYELMKSNLEAKLKESRPNLVDKHHEMEITVTADMFANRYNADISSIRQIIDKTANEYRAYKEAGDLEAAHKVITNNADFMIEKIGKDINKISADLATDVLQLLHGATKTNIKKLGYHGSHLELSTSAVTDAGFGVIQMFDLMGTKNWYLMDSAIKMPDAENPNVYKDVLSMDEQMVTDMDAMLSSGELKLESRNARNLAMLDGSDNFELTSIAKQVAENTHTAFTRVYINESVSLLLPTESSIKTVISSLSEGGQVKELKDLLGQDIDGRFLNPNMSNKDLADAVQMIYNAVAMPLYSKGESQSEAANLIKRRKLLGSLNGKVLEDNYYRLIRHMYKKVDLDANPWMKDINDAFDSIGDDTGITRKQKYIVLEDDAAGSVFNSQGIFNKYLDTHKDRLGLTDEQIEQVKKNHESYAKAGTDAASYLTKEQFLLHLGSVGARKDWFNVSEGKISSSKIGALKPKVGYAEVMPDGSVAMFYNKTAFFYDPIVDMILKDAGADVLAFESGAKVNLHREVTASNGTLGAERVKMISSSGDVADSMIDNISSLVTLSNASGNIIEVPYSATTIGNVSREHNANFGNNIGVHFHHNTGVDTHMDLQNTLTNFGQILKQMNGSPFHNTGITQKLMDLKKIEGDNYLSSSALEAVLEGHGLILDSWMGDMAADKLFSHFFSQSKIAMGEAFSSDFAPMAPDLHGKISEQSLPIRLTEPNASVRSVVEQTGEEKMSQRFFGSYSASSRHMNMDFSMYGKTDVAKGGDGGFFIFEGMHYYGMDATQEKHKRNADFIVVPSFDKSREGKDFTVIVDGYEILPDGTLADPLHENSMKSRDYDKKLKKEWLTPEFINKNKKMREEALARFEEINKGIDEAVKNDGRNALTYYQVQNIVERLAPADKKVFIGMLNNRQPRNQINDVVINKVVPPPKDIDGNYYEEHADVGNIGRQNVLDAITPQDADFDFDKSSAYGVVPGNLLYEAAVRAGYGARETNLELMLSNFDSDIQSQYSTANWGAVQQTSAITRGRFVKMHNILTYLQNVIGLDGDMGTVNIGKGQNNQYKIKMKGLDSYISAVDEISAASKAFIDSYKKPPSPDQVNQFIDEIYFGTPRGSGFSGKDSRTFAGIFELQHVTKKNKISLNDQQEILKQIKYKIIQPISRYLRYNKGEISDGMNSKSLKLRDLYNGRADLKNSFDSKNSYNYGFKDDNINVDFREGFGKFNSFFDTSRNPFDISMKSLSETYQSRFPGKSKNAWGLTALILKAENNILNKDIQDTTPLSKELYDYVQEQGSYNQLRKLQDRINYIENNLNYLESSKFDKTREIAENKEKLKVLTEAKSELEIVVGANMDRLSKYNTLTFKEYQAEGSFSANNNTFVIWGSDGKIKEVIKKGDKNRGKIQKGDVAVINGRRFDFVHPEQNRILKSKFQAFSTLPKADGVKIDPNKVKHIVEPIYIEFEKEFQALNNTYRGDFQALSIARRNLVHQYLTGANSDKLGVSVGFNDPLAMEALVYKMLSPNLNTNRVAEYKINRDYNIFDVAYSETPGMSKSVFTYLNEASNKLNFNSLKHDEAMVFRDILKKAITMQTRAFMNNSHDRLPMMNLDFEYSPHNVYMNRLKNATLNRDIKKGKGADHAIESLNQFINGERYLSPQDAYKIAQEIRSKAKVSEVLMSLRTENRGNEKIVQQEFSGLGRKLGRGRGKDIRTNAADYYRRIVESCKKGRL